MHVLGLNLPKATPWNVALRLDFWTKNYRLLLSLGLGLTLFFIFWQRNYLVPQTSFSEDMVSWAITVTLVFMMVWGVWQAILLAAQLEIEAASTFYLGCKTAEESGNQLKLEQIHNLLPSNEHSAAVRLFRHIWMAARIDQFESTSVALQPCRESLIIQQQAVSDLQKMSLHLGILGTFVGLVIAFLGLGGSTDSFQIISKALQYGFSTSVFGLFISLFLGAIVYHIDHRRMVFFTELEKVSDEFLDLVCRAKNENPILEHKYDILRTRIVALDVRMDEQTKFIREGLEKLADTRQQFENILIGVGQREVAFLAEIKGAYDFFSPKVISGSLHESLSVSVKDITDGLKAHLHQTLDRYAEINLGLTSMHNHFKEFNEHLREQSENESKSRLAIQETLTRVTQAQETFAKQFNTQKVQASLEKSIREAGDQVTSEYVRALREMLPHLLALSGNISEFNQKAYAEVKQRDIAQLLRGIGQNFSELFLRLIRGILGIFSKK
jgi:hypothetical protein